jgi:hypothetical protein
MALTAPDLRVLSHKSHPGGVVIEGIDLRVQFPAFGTVALAAADLEIVPVRGIVLPGRLNEHQHQGGQYQWQDSHVVEIGL